MKKASAERIADVAIKYLGPQVTDEVRSEMRRELTIRILKVADGEGL